MELTGAQIVWECLVREGVEVVFGYPGGATLPIYDAMNDYPVHHVLVRHEQAAAHAADGYARVSGKVGVAMATSGPGATNLVTGIATAMMDSSPIVCITGQVATGVLGSDAFQETDVTGVTLPITKHNYLVTRVEDLAQTIREAFYIARTGRPGPVLIDIPKDVQMARTEFTYPEGPVDLPGYQPEPEEPPSESDLDRALELINAAERPVVLAGRGVLLSGAAQELLTFAERGDIPVTCTLLGIGGFPASHRLYLGMMGMHGEAAANLAIQHADLLLAFGMRFDDRVTGNLKTYAPRARKVHVDLDPAELNKNVLVDVAIAGDLRAVLRKLLPGVEARDRGAWLEQIATWREDARERDVLHQGPEDKLYPARVIHSLWRATEGRAIVVTDVGQHQMWVAQYYRPDHAPALVTSGGLGTMGFGLPAGIGAKIAAPDAEVWVVCGDGGFQMNLQELGTLAQEGLDLKVAIMNNGFLGMVRQWQEFFFGRRYTATPLLNPDFCRLAEAYGLRALRVKRPEDVVPALAAARAERGPVLVDFWVEKEDNVYPMVPVGADLDHMIRRPRPVREVA
ncbi:MAG: biosynthetic-type acetolactate synthase large subunit [Anaerolineae bacterium]|nr:biosynthetic-type acetolactate synthase large subunit [Anaerolineae bacterium]